MKKSLQDQPTKDATKLPDLSPNLHHVPPLNEDINEDSDPQGEQDKTSCQTQTHHHHQDRPTVSTAATPFAKARQCASPATSRTQTQRQRLDSGKRWKREYLR